MRTKRLTQVALAGAALMIVATACSSDSDKTTTEAPTQSDLTSTLNEIVAETGVPGLGAAAYSGSDQLDMAVAGVRSLDHESLIEVDDAFHIGSNTKAMTAALLGRLADQDLGISFDTTLTDAFPEMEIHPDYQQVTLADLLAHTGGAPSDTPDLDAEFLSLPLTEQRAVGAALILGEAPEVAPGTVGRYSNLGYVIVGAAMEAATGSSWKDLIAQELFTPLGMSSYGFGAPGDETKVDQPRGHNASGEPIFDDLPAVIGPAGTAHCSMGDWGKFLTELMSASNGASDFLSAESIDRLLRPIDGIPVEGHDNGRAALGWVVFDGPNGLVYWHNGSNTMWYSETFLVPAIDRVVLGVSNQASTGTPAVGAALAELAEMYPGS